MRKEEQVILGIIPGTRYLGLAVLHDSELRDWRIKTFRGKWSSLKKKKMLVTIERMIDLYQVTALSLKKFHPSRSSKNLDELIVIIQQLARGKGLRTYYYSIKEIEENFLPERRMNKQRLAKKVSEENLELRPKKNQEQENQNRYYCRMFEAVAVSQVCLDQCD